MLVQIGDDKGLVSRTIAGHTHAAALIECVDVFSMIPTRIAAPTFATDIVRAPCSLVAYSEFTFILVSTA